jgi:hypothetical protein
MHAGLCSSPADYELLAAEIDRRLAEAERTDWDNQMLITEDFLMDRKAAKKDVCATLRFRQSYTLMYRRLNWVQGQT